jgi:hypothetical protein
MKNLESEIQKQMKLLNISYEDAKELAEYDYKIDLGIEDEQTLATKPTKEQKAMLRKVMHASSEKTRKVSTKERKVDEEKKQILTTVADVLQEFSPKIKTETEINFAIGENSYTLKLTKHRNPKK